MIPNFLDSTSNKYSNYLQSSLKEEDTFLLKRKLKNYSKIHSHSNSNTNKNNENNKKNNKIPVSSYISYMSPGNNYLLKKKKDNIFIEKALKNHLILTSMNNSSIIHSSKDKGLSYFRIINQIEIISIIFCIIIIRKKELHLREIILIL